MQEVKQIDIQEEKLPDIITQVYHKQMTGKGGLVDLPNHEAPETETPSLTSQQNNIKVLSNSLLAYTREEEALEVKLKDLGKKIKEISNSLIPLMQSQGLNSFKTPAGVTFYINTAPRASVKNPELAFPYLEEIGLDSLIKRTVNANSLSKSVKELTEAGSLMLSDLEPQGIAVYIDESVRIRNKGAAQVY